MRLLAAEDMVETPSEVELSPSVIKILSGALDAIASRGVRREQQFGQRSMIDVLNQEQELLEARVGLAEAERDLMVAERSLATSVGMIGPLLGQAADEG
mgnify:CR=1 FL=1